MMEAGKAGFFVGFILPGIGAALKNSDTDTRAKVTSYINEKLKTEKSNLQPNGKTRLDNRGTVEGSPQHQVVGRRAGTEAIYRTAEAVNSRGRDETVRSTEEREELEARGLNPDWSKTKLRNELKKQSQADGTWLEDSYLDGKTLVHDRKKEQTTENDVYVSSNGNTLTKVNNLALVTGEEHENNLMSLMDRIEAQGALFPSIPYTIKGFMNNKEGHASMVLEQPNVKDVERNATQEEINTWFEENGFTQSGEKNWSNGKPIWSNGQYEITNARPANVLKGKDGKLYFVDVIAHSTEYLNKKNETTNGNQVKDKNDEVVDLSEGSKITWDVYGNESASEWTVGRSVKTRGNQSAVELIQEREDDGGKKTTTHIVPISELQSVKTKSSEAQNQPLAEQTTTKTRDQKSPKTKKPTDAERRALKIAKQYNDEVRNPTKSGVDLAIASAMPQSINIGKYGDKNAIRPGMAKSYRISKKGTPIDVIAQTASLSFDGTENSITPDDIWDFMVTYNSGPKTLTTPAGNSKLADLANKFSALTGKSINRKTAQDFIDRMTKKYGAIEEVNLLNEKYLKDGELDFDQLEKDIQNDPDFQENYDLSDHEFERLNNEIYERQQKRNREGSSIPGRPDQRSRGQRSEKNPEGRTLQAEFGDTTSSAEERVGEITSKSLTHVSGLNMGNGISAGTYLSTKGENRYEGEPQKASVTIKHPFVFKSENSIIPLRNKVLKDNKDKFTGDDLEDPFGTPETIAGIDKLAEMVRAQLQAEGFDSIYLPQTESQEGELIVFDRNNVTIKTKKLLQAESQLKSELRKIIPKPDAFNLVTNEEIISKLSIANARKFNKAQKNIIIQKRKLDKLLDCLKNG